MRRARFSFDGAQLRPYYEIRRVLVDGVFYAATKLYGITFKARKDLKGYSPDMYVFEVFNADGSPLGLFLGDFYARANKRGGAWASAYVPQSGLTGAKPVIGNHLNIPKPAAGEPTLMTHDEVNTMFHEFGHALHGLFSAVKYPFFAGTSVPRDFVESLAGERDVGYLARDLCQLRETLSDREADASRPAGQGRGGRELRPRICDDVASIGYHFGSSLVSVEGR